MKKILSLCLILVFFMPLVGCQGRANDLSIGEVSISKTLHIGLNADTAGIDDAGFNNSAYEGLVKAKNDFRLKYNILQSKEVEDYEKNIISLAKHNSLIFGVGFRMKDSIENVAKNNTNKNFVIIDNVSDLANVKSVTFKGEEGAFLMGVIAGKMTKTNKIGFIGGVEAPIIEQIASGFAYGVKTVNEEASIDLINKNNIRYTMDFYNEEKGYNAAKELYDNGVDIIFHGAGKCGIGVFKAAKEKGKYAIGIDEDQGEKLKEYSDYILSSMVKKTDLVVYSSIREFLKGTFRPGKDNALELGLKEGAIDIASSTKNKVPEDILDTVNKYKELIISGEMEIPKTNNELLGS
ncbi:MAG: BMP family ABC transporter substrate-binding protein [Clostridium perfringens]|nr:BMP family ABC transporter substrate-binding protein [Clostridium perfringens]